MRIGISYVSLAGAAANRDAEIPPRATRRDSVAAGHRAAWNTELQRSGSAAAPRPDDRLLHRPLPRLMQPQTMNDVDGRYLGADLQVHAMEPRPAGAVYGTFSGWDQYRAQIQLLALLRAGRGRRHGASRMIAFAAPEQRRSGTAGCTWARGPT